jgi:hypothetical protein
VLVFASSSILVGAAYYVTVRVSIAAMETLMFDGKGSWASLVGEEDEEDSREQHMDYARRKRRIREKREDGRDESTAQAAAQTGSNSNGGVGEDAAALSPWSFSGSDEDEEGQRNADLAAAVANAQHRNNTTDEDDRGRISQRSSSPASEIEIVLEQNPSKKAEKFTFLKVWTNVYGLAVGMFCIVYSLLLPNELSGFVFCACLWAAGVFECSGSSCSGGGRSGALTRKRRLVKEIMMMKRGHASANAVAQKESSSGGGGVVLTCLCAILSLGIVFKGAGGFMSGKLYEDVAGDGWSAAASVLLPAIGVASIRNMRKTQDIRNTMELSLPVCAMGSLLCLLCVVLSMATKEGTCVHSFFWETTGTEERYFLQRA